MKIILRIIQNNNNNNNCSQQQQKNLLYFLDLLYVRVDLIQNRKTIHLLNIKKK